MSEKIFDLVRTTSKKTEFLNFEKRNYRSEDDIWIN